jgi:hypothetical protein
LRIITAPIDEEKTGRWQKQVSICFCSTTGTKRLRPPTVCAPNRMHRVPSEGCRFGTAASSSMRLLLKAHSPFKKTSKSSG